MFDPLKAAARLAEINARRPKLAPPSRPTPAQLAEARQLEARDRAEAKRRREEQLASCREDVERLRREGEI